MLKKKKMLFLVMLMVVAFAATAFAADLSIKSTLNGKVSSSNLAQPGQVVKEGQTLVMIDSIAGSVVAARATADGTVFEIVVKPGDMISSGQVVATIRTAK